MSLPKKNIIKRNAIRYSKQNRHKTAINASLIHWFVYLEASVIDCIQHWNIQLQRMLRNDRTFREIILQIELESNAIDWRCVSVEIQRFLLKCVCFVSFCFIPLTEVFLLIILKKAESLCLPHHTLKCVLVGCVERRVMLFLFSILRGKRSDRNTCNLICSIQTAHFVDPACVRFVCAMSVLCLSHSERLSIR